MATRFIEQGLDLEQQPLGSVAPFGVESDGVLRIDRGARFKGSLSAAPGPEVVQVNRKPVVLGAATVAVTATAADAGTIFVTGTSATVTVTLPLAATAGAGAEYGLSVGVLATAGGGHNFTPNAADTIKFTSAAAGSLVQCTTATDVMGDLLVLRSDGGTTWYQVARIGTWVAA